MSGRTTYHHGDLRAVLVREGVALLAESGLAGFSVAKVATRAGVSSAAPYRHFPDRESLLAACAAAVLADLADLLAGVAEEAGPDPVERLAATAGAYVRYAIDHRAGIDLLYTHDFTDSHRDTVREQSRRLMDVLMTLAAEALPAATPWADVADFVYVHLSAAYGYATLLFKGTRPPQDVEAHAARATAAARDQLIGHLMRLAGPPTMRP